MWRVSPLASAPADVVPDPPVATLLLREQAPHLTDMPVRPSSASVSSNWVLPRRDPGHPLARSDDYIADPVNEVRWLPRLAPKLPVAVPDVVAVGQPSGTFPRPWAVVSWVPGDLPLALDGSQQALLAGSRASSSRASTLSTPPTSRSAPSTSSTGMRRTHGLISSAPTG